MEWDIKPGRKWMEVRSDDPMIVQIRPIRAKCVVCGGKLIEIHVMVVGQFVAERTVSYCASCGPCKKNLGEWFG